MILAFAEVGAKTFYKNHFCTKKNSERYYSKKIRTSFAKIIFKKILCKMIFAKNVGNKSKQRLKEQAKRMKN